MTDATLRYPGGLTPVTPADLDDNLMGTINRCRAIADLIQAVSNSEDACIMDTTIGDAAFAIITDLEDARDMVNRWYEQERTKMLAQRQEDERKDVLRDSMMQILAKEYPDEKERAAEIDKRMRERLVEEDKLAGIDSRALIYRGILDSVGGSFHKADQIIAEVDKLLRPSP